MYSLKKVGHWLNSILEMAPAWSSSGPVAAFRYGVALVLVGIALGVRELIGPAALGLQFVTFFPAVALAAIYGGFQPGMLAAVVSAILATFLYMPPYHAFSFDFGSLTVWSNLVFFADEIMVCGAIQAMHNHYRNFRIASERLAENHHLLTALVEGTTAAVFLKDTAGRYLHCNAALLRMTGKKQDEVVGRDPDSIFPAEQARLIQEHDRAVMDGGTVKNYEQELTLAQGEKRNFLTIKGPLFDASGNISGLFGIAHDISDKKQAEAALRESHEFNRRIIASSTDCINVLDLAGNLLYMSEGGQHLLEIADIGPYLNRCWIDFWQEPDRPAVADAIAAVRCGGHGQFQAFCTSEKGTPKWWDVVITPILGADGETERLLAVSRDITARKAVENALIEAKQIADKANSAKSAFLANMSHEMRTPLHVITGLGHLLRRDIEAPAQLERLDQLCASADHLLAVVNDVLDISKIEAEQLVLDRSDFRLDTVVAKVVRMVEERAHEKGLMLATNVVPRARGLSLNGDPVRLAQVLINLCSNAVKFTDQGAVRLGIGWLARDAASVTLRFSVEDTGMGISPADQAWLFQPFTQGDSSSTRERGGTGLGLAISRRLVALMGSTIEVDSQPGAGSIFSFDLVLSRATVRVPKAEAAAVPIATDFHGRQVLIAEDHPISQEILFEMLDDLGCEVDVASDGAEAVACARERRYDLILMDMQMPKMDGLVATRAIRELPGYSSTPIIALTANAFVDDRQCCLDAGMNGYLGKPMTPAALAAALGQWLPDLVVPDDNTPVCDNELSRALGEIPGLEIRDTWRRSPEHLVSYRVLLDKFVKCHGQDMERLRQHLAAGEENAAHVVAHNLKGIAGLIDAQRIASFATELVQGLRSGADKASIAFVASACEVELGSLAEAVRDLPAPPVELA